MSTPADPPWLGEATEAGRAAYDSVVIAHGAFGHRAGHHDAIIAAIRAALPHIAQGVLGEASDHIWVDTEIVHADCAAIAGEWLRSYWAARQVTA